MAEKKPIGTVLVAGAGISGTKAAIELAEAGYKADYTAGLSPEEDTPLSVFRAREFSEVTDGKDLPVFGSGFVVEYPLLLSFHEVIP